MHAWFMREAITLATEAGHDGEVPVGAVVVVEGEIVGRGRNSPISLADPTAHAEILALRQACARIGNYRLPEESILYSTIEPCLMCVGAMVHARLSTLVYGAPEPKAGAIQSTQRAHEHPALNHRLTVVEGILPAECRDLMQQFFKNRR